MTQHPKTQLVGILNLTPDSFSDGNSFSQAENAFAALTVLEQQGADIIDIGAESTRPGATPVSAEEEWARLEPVLAHARARHPELQISIDTRHAQTARKALALGVHWINDVSGYADPAMVDAVKHSACRLVVMHSLSIPADASVVMKEEDVMESVRVMLARRAHELEEQGIRRDRIIIDPGIGFGKTPTQSVELLKNIDRLNALELPVLVGHSRKSFLTQFTDAPPAQRDDETLVLSTYLAMRGVKFLRVHDIARHRTMLSILEAVA